MSTLKHFLRFLGSISLLAPILGHAQRTLTVGLGTQFNFLEITTRIIDFLAGSIGFIASAIFLVGALYVVTGGVKEENVSKGKTLMIDSLIGLGVTLGAYAIVRTAFYFLSPM